MTWFGWFLIVWWLLVAVVTVLQVGKPRKPVDAGTAAMGVIICAFLIACTVTVGVNN